MYQTEKSPKVCNVDSTMAPNVALAIITEVAVYQYENLKVEVKDVTRVKYIELTKSKNFDIG